MKYQITSPDGRELEITAPEGATEEEIISYAQQNMPQSTPKPAVAPSLEEQRTSVADGITLRPFGIDTGIEMPQGVTEALAGMGRRFSQIGTLGLHKGDQKTNELLDDSGYATAGGAVADLSTILAGGSLLKGAGAIPKVGKWLQTAGQALSAPKTLTQAVVGGGLYGGATSNDRASGAIGGAVGGGLGYGIPKAVASVIKPTLKNGAGALIKKGVKLTPGEMMGGVTQRAEDAATSIPVIGDAIKSAKGRSLAAYSRSVVDDVLKPIGKSLDDHIPAGREAIEQADRIISNEYDRVLGSAKVKVDQVFADQMNELFDMAQKLPPKEAKKFSQIVNDRVYKYFDNPTQTTLGDTFKKVDSGLRTEYKRFLKSSDPFQQDLGNALRTAHKNLLDMLKRQDGDAGKYLDKLDVSYAKLMRVTDAAGYKGAHDGVFTPDHMLSAIKKTTGKKAYAAGKGFDQKELETAKEMLAQTMPDSGTTTRALFNMASMGGAYALDPSLLAGILAGAGAYTRPGQAVIRPLLASRPAIAGPVAQGIKSAAPKSALAGVIAGVNLK